MSTICVALAFGTLNSQGSATPAFGINGQGSAHNTQLALLDHNNCYPSQGYPTTIQTSYMVSDLGAAQRQHRMSFNPQVELEQWEVQTGNVAGVEIPGDHVVHKSVWDILDPNTWGRLFQDGTQAADTGILEEIAKEYQTKEPYGVVQETLSWLYHLHFEAASDISALEKTLIHFQAAVYDADNKPL